MDMSSFAAISVRAKFNLEHINSDCRAENTKLPLGFLLVTV